MTAPTATNHHYRAWRKFNVSLLRTTPLWGRAAMGADLRVGQTYGTPLTFGLIKETGEGYFGEKASQWQKAREARLKAEQEAAKAQRPPHPDSPVFRDNAPTP